jgi:putative SOS response-associated peptidase YedK
MPVILADDAVDRWLDQSQTDLDALRALLAPAPEDLLIATEVSKRANSVKNDDPACLEPYEPPQSQATLL